MEKGTFIGTLAVILVLLVGAAVIALPNRVRWNPNLEECVYYYTPPGSAGAQCFVNESNCEQKAYVYAHKDVDPSTCYYVPRNEQNAPGGCQEFREGDTIVLDYKGTDPDKDVGPAGKLVYTVGEPFDGENTWRTKRGDAGTYHVTVKVSDGELEDTQELCFAILSGNHPPVLSVKDVTVDEGERAVLRPTCADEDGDALHLSYEGAMTSDAWETSYGDAGTHKVTVTCSEVQDGGLSDTAIVQVTVQNVDRAPTLSVSDVTVHEGELVTLRAECSDPEGTGVTITYGGAMTKATWQTGYDDAGTHDVTVTCADASGKSASEDATVTVQDRNRPPQITAIVRKG
jgi:hypothetical protein